MDIEQIRSYCLNKKGVTEEFPFDEHTLVFKVLGKMYALISLKKWEEGEAAINLKANPEYAIELRETYHNIRAGYHMNKKHWNTVYLQETELHPDLVKSLIDHSYKMVVQGMTKKMQSKLEEL
ncbi:MmcQ/YjbR family DNA-binding protein [Tamlana agarivorans]|uniref:MmcQ/YjbR family DNA-binding protein n=1 Tax=Pseudotamlana agarivorans TaxID=481183 RepID=A0ACC5U6M7_9FLAO|nr:MmcQ/YjbR family DNA-binding protein [Tamlana agarivorans]MBU2949972.1 MmcQ/YjbR family DNA-binding protein [Tamlana agarivorans]